MMTRAQRSSEKDEEGHTALMVAALAGHTKEVEALLLQGVDINAKDSMGRSALMLPLSTCITTR